MERQHGNKEKTQQSQSKIKARYVSGIRYAGQSDTEVSFQEMVSRLFTHNPARYRCSALYSTIERSTKIWSPALELSDCKEFRAGKGDKQGEREERKNTNP